MEKESSLRARPFFRFLIALAALSLAGSVLLFGRALPSRWDDQGTFVVTLRGQQVGIEQFEIRREKDHLEAKAEITLQVQQDGKHLEFHTSPDLVLDRNLNPLSYTWNQKGAQKSNLKITFLPSPAKVSYHTIKGQSDNREFFLPKDIVILDDNVFDHYQVLVDRYAMTSGGKQTFKVFIPQEAFPGVLTVQDRGTEPLTLGGKTEKMRHLVVTTDRQQLDLWVDRHGRLQEIAIPAIQFQVVRKP